MSVLKTRCQILGRHSEAECDALCAEVLRRKRLMPFSNGTVNAYVNHGRWVAMCTKCNSGIACTPGVRTAVCMDCGAQYSVVFPADVDGIAAALAARAEVNQNWQPHESVADLRRENKGKGVG